MAIEDVWFREKTAIKSKPMQIVFFFINGENIESKLNWNECENSILQFFVNARLLFKLVVIQICKRRIARWGYTEKIQLSEKTECNSVHCIYSMLTAIGFRKILGLTTTLIFDACYAKPNECISIKMPLFRWPKKHEVTTVLYGTHVL